MAVDYPRSVASVYINEIFDSIQGEGALAGFRTLFIRFHGCHVGCAWCDTKYSWKVTAKHKKEKGSDLVKKIRGLVPPETWICITGGEPLEQIKPLLWLSQRLHRFNYRKQSVETAGIIGYNKNGVELPDKKDIIDLFYNDVFMSISPKLESALGKRFNFEDLKDIVRFWIETYPVYYKMQFKFVVSIDNDLEVLSELKDRIKSLAVHNIFIQIDFNQFNNGSGFSDKVVKWLVKNDCYRLSIQQHKILNLR